MASPEVEKKGGLSRREWLRLGAAFGVGAVAGGLAAYELARLLGPPATVAGEVRDTIYRTHSEGNSLVVGAPVRVTDFQEWQGGSGIWRGVFVPTASGASYVEGSGLPVVAIRVKRDDAVFSAPPPTEVPLPTGFGLFYDDPSRDLRIVVLFQRCTHLCCKANWHATPVLAGERDYLLRPPTYDVFGQDPIFCSCHSAQWDPMVLVKDVHPNGARYVGAQVVHGPASRALPIVPVRADADVLIGGMADPAWYTSYCQ